jgi:hypothetical protein
VEEHVIDFFIPSAVTVVVTLLSAGASIGLLALVRLVS